MKKKLKIALGIILALLCVFVIVCYCVWKEQTLEVFEHIKYYINQPLPIIGVSTIVVCIFIYKCFVGTKYGKKALAQLQEEKEHALTELKQKEIDLKVYAARCELQLNRYQEKIEEYKSYVLELAKLSRNIKAQDIVEKLEETNHGENQDSETTEE